MASIRKHATGWRAFIDRKGIRKSKVFPTRQEAKDWAAREEYKILNSRKVAAAMKLADVFDRYAREVSPARRGHRWEVMRLESFARALGHHRLGDLEPRHFTEWRDARLREVAPGTVRREMGLLGSVLRTAREEWGLMSVNPLEGVRKPSEPPPRDRLPTAEEIERLAHVAGPDLSTATARAFHAFRFACETAMRAGEIVGLTWDAVDLENRVAHLPKTKNGYSRDVPLSGEALRLLREIEDVSKESGFANIFGLSSRQLDALFRAMKAKAGVQGLTFHDSRHYATVQLAKKVPVLDLARILGHRDLRMLMVYYNETASDIAKKLD